VRIIAPPPRFVTVTDRERSAINPDDRINSEEGLMTARIHSAVLHRVAVPAWLLAVVLAAAIGASLIAALDSPATPAPVHSLAPSTCVDSTLVGHC
jgi:hypothetical protein